MNNGENSFKILLKPFFKKQSARKAETCSQTFLSSQDLSSFKSGSPGLGWAPMGGHTFTKESSKIFFSKTNRTEKL